MADPTIIDAGTRIDGRISGDADVTVQGRVDGEIALTQTLTVAEDGLVRGTIKTLQTIVEGTIDGDIVADERIFLTATARVVGSLQAPIIQVDDGARFSGEVIMELEGVAAAPSARRTTTATSGATTRPVETASTRASEGATTRPVAATAGATTRPYDGAATRPVQNAGAAATTTTTVVEQDEEAEQAEPSEAEETDITDMSTPQLEDYTVKELREELRERDLQVSGTKDELIERLQNAGD
jgi:cytoskeletal protein CcmA (bactofilin family)